MNLNNGKSMNILIGPENVNDALKDTSVVMASYDIGDNMKGIIGVVGPTRMDYAKVTARLSYFADSLTPDVWQRAALRGAGRQGRALSRHDPENIEQRRSTAS